MKCDAFGGSLLNGVRQTILYNFVLDKPPGFKVVRQTEIIRFKKINKYVVNTITFYLEDDKQEEVNFNGETTTFSLKLVKNHFFAQKMSFQKPETDNFCVGGRHMSATTKNVRDITSKKYSVMIGHCSKCNRKKRMT